MCIYIYSNRDTNGEGKKRLFTRSRTMGIAKKGSFCAKTRLTRRVRTHVITYGYPVANTEIRGRQHVNPLLANPYAVQTTYILTSRSEILGHSQHIVITISVAKPGGTYVKKIKRICSYLFHVDRRRLSLFGATKVVQLDVLLKPRQPSPHRR